MGERGRKGAGSAQEAPATDAWPRGAAPQPAGYPNTQPGGRTAGECPLVQATDIDFVGFTFQYSS